jgi:hypothetical protein
MAQDGGEYGRVDRQGGCPAFEEDATVFTGVRERGATGRMHSSFLLHRPRYHWLRSMTMLRLLELIEPGALTSTPQGNRIPQHVSPPSFRRSAGSH